MSDKESDFCKTSVATFDIWMQANTSTLRSFVRAENFVRSLWNILGENFRESPRIVDTNRYSVRDKSAVPIEIQLDQSKWDAREQISI